MHVLTSQRLVYKDCRVILTLVIPKIENVDKTPKLIHRINLGLSSDLGIGIPRLIPSS